MTFQELFPKGRAVIAMVHMNGFGLEDKMDRARREIEIYYRNGVDAVLVENYYGSASDCEYALEYLQKYHSEKIYGVNILGNTPRAFDLANRYGAEFIQIDSVAGHLPPKEDGKLAAELETLRAGSGALVLGGVRFKYHPVRSGRTVEEDLVFGRQRCDAVVVTGKGTGIQTDEQKIRQFRETLGTFPLITGAGVTLDTVQDTLKICDGVIVGSWFKKRHRADYDVEEKYVRQFMTAVRNMDVK